MAGTSPFIRLSLQQLHQLQRAIGVSNSGSVISTVNVAPQQSPECQPVAMYSYRVKIMNPCKKNDVIMVRELHTFSSKFVSVSSIRNKLRDEFQNYIPNSEDFNIGYLDSQTKIWLVTSEDVQSMYRKFNKGGLITLWCNGKPSEEEISTENRKRKRSIENDDGDRAMLV